MARKTKESNLQATLADISQRAAENLVEPDAHFRSRCGGMLRTTRESQGLSIQDIASRLKLGVKQIEAIEADNFAALPEPTIVRGFIRNYAKQLKLNAEPLLDAYSVIVPSAAPHELVVKPSVDMKMTSREKPKAGSYVWAVLAVLLGLGAWFFYENYVQKPSPTMPIASSVDKIESLPEPALPAAERAIELQSSTALTLPAASANEPVTADTTTNPVAPIAQNDVSTIKTVPPSATLPASAAVEMPATPLPNGAAKLEFNATQETWVRVIDASGREVYSKTIFAGSRESIIVNPPLNITVGNSGATSLSMNGKSVNLAPYSRNNVAHIKLNN